MIGCSQQPLRHTKPPHTLNMSLVFHKFETRIALDSHSSGFPYDILYPIVLMSNAVFIGISSIMWLILNTKVLIWGPDKYFGGCLQLKKRVLMLILSRILIDGVNSVALQLQFPTLAK